MTNVLSGFHHLVDSINASVVRWRVGGRPGQPDAAELERIAAGHGALLEPPPVRSTAFAPHRLGAAGRLEQWADDTTGWRAQREPVDGARRALVVLHGWLAIQLQVAGLRLSFAPVRRRGVEVWYPWLPEHGTRTAPDAVSGERCVSADIVATAEALRRGVDETVQLVEWLVGSGYTVAVSGVSLGGWTAALAATRCAQIERLVLWTPVVDPASSFVRSPLVAHIRTALQAAEVRPEVVHQVLAQFAPVAHHPEIPGDRILVLGARHDNVVEPASLEALAERWDARLEWLEAGHITAQWSLRARRLAHDWILR